MREIVDDMGKTITKKYKNPHTCFRHVAGDQSGTLSKQDGRVFFNRFAYPPEVADRFFNECLTLDSEGLCDYREFASHFTPFITQGFDGRLTNRGPAEEAMAEFE